MNRLVTGWANNATSGPVEGPILVDGAKRDRCVPLPIYSSSLNAYRLIDQKYSHQYFGH
jgi:hypothetical protein